MKSDHHTRQAPTEHELVFFGRPARVMMEIDLGRNNATAQIPIGDLTTLSDAYGISEVRIPLCGTLLRRIEETTDQAGFHGLDG